MTDKTILSLIKREIQKTLAGLVFVFILAFACYEVFSFYQRVKQIEGLVVNQIASLASNKMLAQDYLALQQELSRFIGSLKSSLPYSVRVNVRLSEQLIAGDGAIAKSIVPTTEIIRSIHLPSGQELLIAAEIGNSDVAAEGIVSLLLIFGACYVVYRILMTRLRMSVDQLSRPLMETISWVERLAENIPTSLSIAGQNTHMEIKELSSLQVAVNRFVDEIRELETNLSRLQYDKARTQIAEQVVHDIRSPLSSIDLRLNTLPGLTDDERKALHNSIGRIRTVLSDLAIKTKQDELETKSSGAVLESAYLVPIIEEMVAEKRVQYAERSKATIELVVSDELLTAASMIDKKELGRALSNIIDNAFDAIDKLGSVTVTLTEIDERYLVVVNDDGCGIPENLVSKIGLRGFSFGKSKGSGFGVSHAKDVMSACGGSLTIESKIGHGTCITLSFLRDPTPRIPLSKIELRAGQKFVVVEDDLSMRLAWNLKMQGLGITPVLYEMAQSCLDDKDLWLNDDAFFAVDYDFKNEKINGIDLIRELNIADRCVLISGKWNSPEVVLMCDYFDIKRFPKEMLAQLHISVGTKELKPNDSSLYEAAVIH